MTLDRDHLGAPILDINVLSGLVKVGYDRLNRKPNVNVEVFGIGNGKRTPVTPEYDLDEEVVDI